MYTVILNIPISDVTSYAGQSDTHTGNGHETPDIDMSSSTSGGGGGGRNNNNTAEEQHHEKHQHHRRETTAETTHTGKPTLGVSVTPPQSE